MSQVVQIAGARKEPKGRRSFHCAGRPARRGAIQSQLRQYGANLDVLSTGAFVSMIVPLIVFFAFQRYFVQALLAGSQK